MKQNVLKVTFNKKGNKWVKVDIETMVTKWSNRVNSIPFMQDLGGTEEHVGNTITSISPNKQTKVIWTKL